MIARFSSYHAMNPLSVSLSPHLLVVKSQFYWLGGFWMLASSSFETFIALQTNAPLVIYQSKKRASGGGNFTRNGKRLNTLLFLHTADDYTESISNKSIIHRVYRELDEKCALCWKMESSWCAALAFASHIKTRSENRLTERAARTKSGQAGGVYLRKIFSVVITAARESGTKSKALLWHFIS